MEITFFSLNIYVLVWDFRILYLLDNTHSFMLFMFLPLGFHEKNDAKVSELNNS